MENLSKQIGYLKGLMEGIDFLPEDRQGKLLEGMLELLEALTDRVQALDDLVADLDDYVGSIDDDLAELEQRQGEGDPDYMDDEFGRRRDVLHLLKDADDREEDGSDAESSGAKEPGGPAEEPDEDDPDADDVSVRVCPECHQVFFSAMADAADARYECPHCGRRVVATLLTPQNVTIVPPVDGR